MGERQKRNERRQLRIGRSSLARLVGDVGEPDGVARPASQIRHHLLTIDVMIDHEVLQRLHLDDDQVLAARGAEKRTRTAAQGGPVREPPPRVVDIIGAGARPHHRRPRIAPDVVRVVPERAELFDQRAIAEYLIESALGEHTRHG